MCLLACATATGTGNTLAAATTSSAGQVSRSGSAGNNIRLVDVSAAMGLDFVHFAGTTAEKHMPEIMGGGVAWIDYDADGRWDLYLVDGGPLPGLAPLQPASPGAGANVLFRARSAGGYERAPAAGVGNRGFGMGVAAGDYDADGFVDLFVSNFGANALYRNNGDGTYSDVTTALGVGDRRWGSSCAWGDLDRDGFPELFVANYLDYDVTNARVCGDLARGIRAYCQPELYDGVDDLLYRNIGGQTFEEISTDAGVANAEDGKGLGVAIVDMNGDRLPDVYVANDGTRNFLYANRGQLRFEDQGLFSGAGLSINGVPQSGMGIDVADLDGDGMPEIGVTNFETQAINMYRSTAPGLYTDETFRFGTGETTWTTLGFGLVFVDLDGDGDRDVLIANGHVLDHVANFAQPNQVFANRHAERWIAGSPHAEGLLEEIMDPGPPFAAARVSRALSHGDSDGDGWPDILVSNLGGPIELLRNDSRRENRRLVIRLRGRDSNRDAFGARVVVTTHGDRDRPFRQYFEVTSATSYISQSSTDLHVGLGSAAHADILVEWPDGSRVAIGTIDAGQLILVHEGHGGAFVTQAMSP